MYAAQPHKEALTSLSNESDKEIEQVWRLSEINFQGSINSYSATVLITFIKLPLEKLSEIFYRTYLLFYIFSWYPSALLRHCV